MVFPTGVNCGRVCPPPPENMLIPSHLEQFHPSSLPTTSTNFYSPQPLSNNFQVITQ